MPNANGRFRGISVPELPWPNEERKKAERNAEQRGRQIRAAEYKRQIRNRDKRPY